MEKEVGSSSRGGDLGNQWAEFGRQLQGIRFSSSLPQSRIPGVKLPIQPLQQYDFCIVIGLAKTFQLVGGITWECYQNQSINLSNYYVHFLSVEPEPSADVQLPYDQTIPPPHSELDKQLNFRWVSFTFEAVSGLSEWRMNRWERHGAKNPIYDQELYFHNACEIHKFLDIKNKMDEIGQYLQCSRVSHAGYKWREAKASTLTRQMSTRLGFRPQLHCRLVEGRWCLYEWKFKLSSALELSSYSYAKRYGGGFSDDVLILF